jgi:hypothetical protein
MKRSSVLLALRSTATVLGMLALYFVIPVPGDNGQDLGVTAFLALLGLGALTIAFLSLGRRARNASDDRGIRLEALGAVLYAFICFMSLVYVSLAATEGQFAGINNRMDALYFTMSTIATVGFGDVHATGTLSRAVVTAQIAADLIIVGLVARIILPSALSVRQRQRESREAAAKATEAGPDDPDVPTSP